MYDPARTVSAKSATTGKVVFSWVGQKLIVWEATAGQWMPDQIIDDIFQVEETYHPIKIGVEQDGLEEFILQPLRSAMTTRRCIIPVAGMRAPAGKIPFIRSLQPFFTSGQVEFAKPLPDLEAQLLSFPTGKIDVPNALAYALRMRPGLPIYEDFGFKNVQENVVASDPCCLSVNATRQYTAVCLLQVRDGALCVLRDWVAEGDPGGTLHDIVLSQRVLTAGRAAAFAPAAHWKTFDAIGLRPAAASAGVRLSQGGDGVVGREELRRRCREEVRNQPALQVSPEASWTLRAFSGGYARSVVKGREVVGQADEGPYKVLMEGLEAFAAVLSYGFDMAGEDVPNYTLDASGRRYASARPQHHGTQGPTALKR
jgi:hypothetical protein